MPNEKVKYFKDYNLIKEKIVYVKDKDLLGYDSSNPRAFQFRYWKMKKYGISNNVIVMDDDYFIGSKLEKSDFFHIKDGKVLPSIVTSNFLKLDKLTIKKKRKEFRIKTKLNKQEQSGEMFHYCEYSTFLFILNLFHITLNEKIFIPLFTHNAIPVNLNDIKEIYDLIYNSDYKYATLDSLYRNVEGLQFEVFILLYTFIKYDRKIKNISHSFIKLNNSIHGNYKYSLFCINKGAGSYPPFKLYQEKIVMEYLFPVPSPYEIVDYSFLNLPYNISYSIIENEKKYNNKISHVIIKKYFFQSLYPFFLLIIIFLKIKKTK